MNNKQNMQTKQQTQQTTFIVGAYAHTRAAHAHAPTYAAHAHAPTQIAYAHATAYAAWVANMLPTFFCTTNSLHTTHRHNDHHVCATCKLNMPNATNHLPMCKYRCISTWHALTTPRFFAKTVIGHRSPPQTANWGGHTYQTAERAQQKNTQQQNEQQQNTNTTTNGTNNFYLGATPVRTHIVHAHMPDT